MIMVCRNNAAPAMMSSSRNSTTTTLPIELESPEFSSESGSTTTPTAAEPATSSTLRKQKDSSSSSSSLVVLLQSPTNSLDGCAAAAAAVGSPCPATNSTIQSNPVVVDVKNDESVVVVQAATHDRPKRDSSWPTNHCRVVHAGSHRIMDAGEDDRSSSTTTATTTTNVSPFSRALDDDRVGSFLQLSEMHQNLERIRWKRCQSPIIICEDEEEEEEQNRSDQNPEDEEEATTTTTTSELWSAMLRSATTTTTVQYSLKEFLHTPCIRRQVCGWDDESPVTSSFVIQNIGHLRYHHHSSH